MNRAFIVLGVGRDGTSLIAGILHRLGVYLGDELIGGNTDNPLGFYEFRLMPTMNRLICSEHGVGEYDSGFVMTETKWEPYLEMFWQIMAGNHQIVGVKDPRFCLTLPVWMRQIEKHHKPTVIAVTRNFDDHYKSMRSGWHPKYGSCSQYIRARKNCQHFLTKCYGAVLFDYDDLVAKPQEEVGRLAEELGLSGDRQDAIDFVQPKGWRS